jgi:hypothetical protein
MTRLTTLDAGERRGMAELVSPRRARTGPIGCGVRARQIAEAAPMTPSAASSATALRHAVCYTLASFLTAALLAFRIRSEFLASPAFRR